MVQAKGVRQEINKRFKDWEGRNDIIIIYMEKLETDPYICEVWHVSKAALQITRERTVLSNGTGTTGCTIGKIRKLYLYLISHTKINPKWNIKSKYANFLKRWISYDLVITKDFLSKT